MVRKFPIAGVADVQVPEGSPEDVCGAVAPTHGLSGVIVPELGSEPIVTGYTTEEQAVVYVTVAVPGVKPVTAIEEEVPVGARLTSGEAVQVPPDTASDNVIELPAHTNVGPVIGGKHTYPLQPGKSSRTMDGVPDSAVIVPSILNPNPLPP